MRVISLLLVVVFVLLSGAFVALGATVSRDWYFGLLGAAPFALLGTWDLFQVRHSITRNFPILGHLRFIAESIRPELMQYFVEADEDGRPYNRVTRTAVYQRAKDIEDIKPFGTEIDTDDVEYEWITHSIAPKPKSDSDFRVTIGGDQCKKPYSASLLNISAMSYGAISPHAIEAMNAGARTGGFYHDTGEGGVSPHHEKPGGDLVWEVGTGYFGCRDDSGNFDPGLFHETSVSDQIKMVEIKVSQGAKAGHGGVLPAAKIDEQIARVRHIPMGQDCISPAYHTAFSNPAELLEFTAQLRELSGGKPGGFKLCIGRHHEFIAICKAMKETGSFPDFIVIDGGEGGTGAGPKEFVDHMGTPLTEGLIFAHNALVGFGVRDRIRLGASAKIATGFGVASRMAMGADWCNAARAFMFAVGCIQAERCHTNTCPVGVATQDTKLYRGLVVSDKAKRVHNFHKNTMDGLAEVTAGAGLSHPSEFEPYMLSRRVSPADVQTYAEIYHYLEPGQLLDENAAPDPWKRWLALSSGDTFDRIG